MDMYNAAMNGGAVNGTNYQSSSNPGATAPTNISLINAFDPNQGTDRSAPQAQQGLGQIFGAGGMYGNLLGSGGTGGGVGPGVAPTYSANGLGGNTNAADPALAQTLLAGNAGGLLNGINAFAGGGFMPYSSETTNNPGQYNVTDNRWMLDQVADATGYQGDRNWYNGATPYSSTGLSSLQDSLKNYYGIAGMSNGWDGSANPRSSAMTLYQRDPSTNMLNPITAPRSYTSAENPGWAKGQGAETLTALSMMLPIFGGAGGLLGAGASGTLSAGAGLGATNALAGAIGTGATNALVNAGTQYALSGGAGGTQGLLGSLGGALLGAAGNSAFGNSGGLGSMFDGSGAASLGSTYNPMSGMNQIMNSTGLGGTMLGGASGLFSALGGGGFNANTLQQAGGSLAGQYLGRQIDPRLQGLGGTAGRTLANLYGGQ